MWEVTEGPVLYINLERSEVSLERREAKIRGALGVHGRSSVHYIHARGHSLKAVATKARAYVARNPGAVVFLDSISRSGLGKLVEEDPASQFTDTMNYISETWLAIGHTPRGDDSHIFGSVHFDAGEDIGIKATAELTNNVAGVSLQVVKSNDIARPPTAYYSLEFGPDGLEAVSKAGAIDFPELAARKAQSWLEQVEGYLLEVGSASATEIAKETGLQRNHVSTILSKENRFVKLGRQGHTVFYGLLATDGQLGGPIVTEGGSR